jgi:hypothetical protein
MKGRAREVYLLVLLFLQHKLTKSIRSSRISLIRIERRLEIPFCRCLQRLCTHGIRQVLITARVEGLKAKKELCRPFRRVLRGVHIHEYEIGELEAYTLTTSILRCHAAFALSF